MSPDKLKHVSCIHNSIRDSINWDHGKSFFRFTHIMKGPIYCSLPLYKIFPRYISLNIHSSNYFALILGNIQFALELKFKELQQNIKMESERNENPGTINGVDGPRIFISKHQNQLESSGVPQHLWTTLYRKLMNMVSSPSYQIIH